MEITKKEILINASTNETRVAIVEDGKLVGVPLDAHIPKGIYLITATSENQIYSQRLIVK